MKEHRKIIVISGTVVILGAIMSQDILSGKTPIIQLGMAMVLAGYAGIGYALGLKVENKKV